MKKKRRNRQRRNPIEEKGSRFIGQCFPLKPKAAETFSKKAIDFPDSTVLCIDFAILRHLSIFISLSQDNCRLPCKKSFIYSPTQVGNNKEKEEKPFRYWRTAREQEQDMAKAAASEAIISD